jgi:hypothetical protein
MNPFRNSPTLAALVLAAMLAACGGSTSSTAASAESSAAGSEAASPSPSVAASTPALPSSGTVADLEALIPNEIGGITLQKFSMRGNEFVSSGSASEETREFLEDLGVSTDDVAVAFGFGGSTASGEGAVVVFVFRALGAGSDRLVTVFMEATDKAREAPLDWQPTTVGGKGVYRAADPEQNNQTVYLYAIDDTLFFLAATREADAAEALAALP